MNISVLKKSKFLTRKDVVTPILVTITDCHEVNVALEGAPEEMRWALSFSQCDKPLVLNSTNGQIIAKILGSEESDNWRGKMIVLYDDPTIQLRGKVVGGIRVRAPRGRAAVQAMTQQNRPQPAPAPAQTPMPAESEEEMDVPF